MQGIIPYSYLTAYGFVSVVVVLFKIITIEQLKTSRQNASWARDAEKTSAQRQSMLVDISRVVEGLSHTGRELGVQLDRSEHSVSRSMDNAETFGARIVSSLESIEDTLTTAAGRLDESSKKIPGALEGLSSFSENMTSSVATMKQEVDDVVQGASATGASADQFSHIAREGVDVVSQTSRAMTKISENSVFLEELLMAVEDIAGQMSILSINASIEAARAGTYGDGFAVVAQEVRKLAEQANRQLSSSFEQIEEMQKAVTRGADLSNQLSGSLETILAEAEQTAVRIRGMLSKLENQQNQTSQLMSSAMEMSEDIRAVKDLSDISSEENSRLSEAIGDVSNTLGEVGSLLANQQEDTGELRTAVKELGGLGRQNLTYVDSLKEVVQEED